jgi:hypothetical protein
MKLIKKYSLFLKESISPDDFGTMGEYIEKLAENDDYALSIIAQYTKDINPTVRLANALNLLPERRLKFIADLILRNKSGEKPEKAEITANTDLSLLENVDLEIGGKNLFKCFLKILTGLGQKNIASDWDLKPVEFINYFCSGLVNHEEIESVFSRYDFFEENLKKLGLMSNSQLYFGIKDELIFEYGLLNSGQNIVFGQFKMTNAVYKALLELSSPSAVNLKLFLEDFNYNNLKLVDKIKTAMSQFNPGYFERSIFVILDQQLKFGYYGIGKWDNGKMDEGELQNIKVNFKNFLLTQKWSDYVKFSLKSEQFWLYFNFKLK